MAPLINFVGKKLVDLYKYDLEEADVDVVAPCTQSPLDKNDIDAVKDDVTAENYEPRIGNRINGRVNQNFQPSQHIYREPTNVPKTEENKETWSMIEVRLDPAWRHAYPPRAGDGSLPYWSHYDLLGLFLSLMGPAEYNSDRFNFFLPLTAVYARWSFTIGGNRNRNKLGSSQAMAFKPKPGFGKPPAIFQCTWITGTDSKVDFSLGASMGGQNYGSKNKETGENNLGSWSERLQRSRFNLFEGWNSIEKSEWKKKDGGGLEPFSFENSPGIDSGLSTTKFGNCGETYPFVQMLGQYRTTGRTEMKGLALNSPFLGHDGLWENYSLADIHIEAQNKRQDEETSYKWIWSPCRNCTHLIKVAGADEKNFIPGNNPPSEKDLKEVEGFKVKVEVSENGHLVSA
ncbi:hypothetical protein FANTH_9423 [Fusarium anthophilum]|uniref:Uncharacterized protein n=1 Tax=Fusarium anthophilum TaxID=48485 RepID=A0A8H5DYR1_9HYPO|nr:hypothetical protein FANTH_9423 [Fusarium anthophilum]